MNLAKLADRISKLAAQVRADLSKENAATIVAGIELELAELREADQAQGDFAGVRIP